MDIIYKDDVSVVSFNESLKTLTITWSDKKPTFDEYKKPFHQCLEFMKTNKVENYISDIRNQPIISPDYRKWLQETALPKAAEMGLKRVVGVSNANVFKQYYINHVFQSAKKFGLPFKLFKTVDEAYEWFKSSEQ